jgi:phosphonoacetaldehyde hydrolase
MPNLSSPLKAVILDWAGTTVDYGSRAPTQVFREIFRQRGVDITDAEARGPMGRGKRDHIAAIIGLPRVSSRWREVFGNDPSDKDVQAIYDDFLPLQKLAVARESQVIPGIPEAITELRRRGCAIGSTTGYTRELMEVVIPIAAKGGYKPDVVVFSDDVRAGRPAPWMNFRAAEQLGVYPMNSVIVVDDTSVGIEAGLHAGAWTVAVSQTGNALGMSLDEFAALPQGELTTRLVTIERDFLAAGAHLVIRSVAELPDRLVELERLAIGKV